MGDSKKDEDYWAEFVEGVNKSSLEDMLKKRHDTAVGLYQQKQQDEYRKQQAAAARQQMTDPEMDRLMKEFMKHYQKTMWGDSHKKGKDEETLDQILGLEE